MRLLRASFALLTVVVLIALGGFALDHNWPKFLRVASSFAAYGLVLAAAAAVATRREAGSASMPFWPFALAGAAAGIVSGLVRPDVNGRVLAAGTIGAALLLGGVHWLGVRYSRGLRDRLMVTTGRHE